MPDNLKDMESLKDLAQCLCKVPMSTKAIANRYGIAERTAYRWLDYLMEWGYDVISRRKNGDTVYSILSK